MLFTKLFMTSSTLLFIASTTTTKTVASKASNTIPIWNTKQQQQQQHTNHDNNHRQFNNNNNIHNIIDDSSSNNEIEVSIREQQEDKIQYDGQIHYDDDDNSTVSILPTHDEQYQQQKNSNINNGIENEITYKSNSKQWKIEEGLPIELQNRATLHKLHIDGCDIYLLGTAHRTKRSCHDVTILMNHIVPDCLFIELCPQRIPILMPPSTTTVLKGKEQQEQPTSSPSSKNKINNNGESVLQEGMTYGLALSIILLNKVQSNYASILNMQADSEFQQAYQSKSKLCRVILGDRPISISLVRSWESLSIFGKIKSYVGLLWYGYIQQPSEKDMQEWMEKVLNDENSDVVSKSIKELKNHFPTIQNIIMNERDLYMYAKIRQTIQYLRCKKLVAIVGAGHCQGMASLFQNNSDNDGKGIDNGNKLLTLLRGIVETKRTVVDENDYIMSLTTDVIELHNTSNTSTINQKLQAKKKRKMHAKKKRRHNKN